MYVGPKQRLSLANSKDAHNISNMLTTGAHRAHIALSELGISFKEVIIDLDRPRDPWYLEINPPGLVPSMPYNGQIILESAVISHFLPDTHPSALLPPSNATGGAYQRAHVSLFVDAFTRVQNTLLRFIGAKTDEVVEIMAQALSPQWWRSWSRCCRMLSRFSETVRDLRLRK